MSNFLAISGFSIVISLTLRKVWKAKKYNPLKMNKEGRFWYIYSLSAIHRPLHIRRLRALRYR